jgi:hypothetical protein
MIPSPKRPLARLRTALGLATSLAAAAALRAQGGPPMITDDPGTPGNGNWEINTAWTLQSVPGSTLVEIPQVDANYGVGDRLQINYQSSWNVDERRGSPAADGPADSQLALKWRYYDAGDGGLQLSTYPRVLFLDPGSGADRRGVADAATSFLLPLELVKDLGPVSLDIDCGRMLSRDASLRGWMGGVCLGREVVKGWEVDAEVHVNASDGFQGSEVILNAGTRIDLTKRTTLLLAVGRDTRSSLGPETTLLTYLGLQVRL